MSLSVLDCIEQRLEQIAVDLGQDPSSKLLVIGLLPRQIPDHLRKSKRIVFWSSDQAVRASRLPKDTRAVVCSKFIEHKATLKLNSLSDDDTLELTNLAISQILKLCDQVVPSKAALPSLEN